MELALLHLLAHGADGGGGLGGGHHWEMPPLHPILVNFTAALIPVSVLSDWLGRWLKRDSLAAAGRWTMLYAAAVTPFTAAAGWWWLLQGEHGDHGPPMVVHQWLGTFLAAAAVALGVWRWLADRDRTAAGGRRGHPGIAYLLAATLVVVALVVQGHLGGRMSFGPGFAEDASAGHNAGPPAPESDQGEPERQQGEGGGSHRHGEGGAPGDEGRDGGSGHHHHDGKGPGIRWRDHIDLNE